MVQFLKRAGKPDIAYMATQAATKDLPFVMFCGGYASDMMGTKASFLESQCRARGQGFVRFDYSGHGRSNGEFMDGTIGSWRDDALAILDEVVPGDVIVIGSSMGGWIALLMGLQRPERIKGIIGIAAAPGFTGWIEESLTDDQRAALETNGYFEEPNEYSDQPYRFTKALLEEGRNHALLPGSIDFNGPVRLLQGMKDSQVEWQVAHRIKNALTSKDCAVLLVEEGDHSLSRPSDLELLDNQIIELTGILGGKP